MDINKYRLLLRQYITGCIWKLDPNESISLDRFAFVRRYMDGEVYLESA